MQKFGVGISLFCAMVFLGLFYHQDLGLNQALLGILVCIIVYRKNYNAPKSTLFWVCWIGVLVLSLCVAWHGEFWSRAVLFFGMMVLVGVNLASHIQWLEFTAAHALTAPFTSQFNFIKSSPTIRLGKRSVSLKNILVTFLIPILIITLFIVFYSQSNPIFDKYVQKILNQFAVLKTYLNVDGILIFIFGLLLFNLYIFSEPLLSVNEKWEKRIPFIQRIRKAKNGISGLNIGLRREITGAYFVMISLNLLLLLLNIADVNAVWIGFTWKGQLLKSFVHEGTGTLIISILVSMLVLVYYFRGNLNFISTSGNLRTLAFLWIIQNGFLAWSVAIRNYRYIEFYGLAFKRIGVYFFLVAIFIGLIFVWQKVVKKHSFRFWINRNAALAVITIYVSAFFDWSTIITKYNLTHGDKSFVHMDFLVSLPDHALPVLTSYKGKYDILEVEQKRLGYGYKGKIDGKSVEEIIDNRVADFLKTRKHTSWQEWSYADYKACKVLQPKK